MFKSVYIILFLLVLAGCVAFVNEGKDGRKVKSFIITEKETADIIDQTSQKTPDKEFQIKWPKK